MQEYKVNVEIEGVAPLLQHQFPLPDYAELMKGGKIKTGEKDYTQEWRKALYVNQDGEVYQPGSHIEGCMIKAAASFKIQGRGNKTYKDLFSGNIFVNPDEILHGIAEPENLDTDGDKLLYLDMRPVVIQRARIVRIRPCFKTGWKLQFKIQCTDAQIQHNVVLDVLALGGKVVGIGDYRPKFGRFSVTKFEVLE